MNASKRTHTSSPEDHENKKSRAQDESSDRLEPTNTHNVAELDEFTELDDVYTVNEMVEPRTAKEDCGDWDEPVILVITRKTRDAFIKRLGNLTKETNETTSSTQLQRTTSHDTSITHKQEIIDTKAAQVTCDYYDEITQNLNHCVSTYTEENLKKNLSTDEELKKFRTVRKALTHFRVAGVKTMNMVRNFENGKTHSLISTHTNIVPNRLNQNTIDQIKHRITKGVTEANELMYNENVRSLDKQIENVNTLMRNTEPIIMAKAWRVVRRTIKQNLQFAFDTENTHETDKDTYKQPKHTDNYREHTRNYRQTEHFRGKHEYQDTYKRRTNPERTYETDRRQRQDHYPKQTKYHSQPKYKENTRTDSYRHQYYDQDYDDDRRQYYKHAPRYKPKSDYRYIRTYETDDNEDYVFYNKEQPYKYTNKHNYRTQTEPDTNSEDEHTNTDRYNTDFPPLPPPKSKYHMHLNRPVRP